VTAPVTDFDSDNRPGSLDADGNDVNAMTVLRRGLEVSPEIRRGFGVTVGLALCLALGRLVIPVLIQQTLDRGIRGDAGYRPGFVLVACVAAVVVILAVAWAGRVTYLRLVNVAETTLLELRQRAFEHLHRLSLADHEASRTGILTARVTSDIETLAQFAQWGAIAWAVNSIVIVATLGVMAVYNWALTLLIIAVYIPIIPLMVFIQKRQFVAYEHVRGRVATTMGAASEAVQGAGVIRAYGYREPVEERLEEASQAQFASQTFAFRFFAWMAPITDGFASVALSVVMGVGVWWGSDLGVSSGELVAFLFLVTILLNPIAELGEVLDQTQTALAGWWKIIQVLDVPIEVNEPVDGAVLAKGPLPVELEDVSFAYRAGGLVLHEVCLRIPAGANVAVVGETGSGKTTLAKLVARLADPTSGRILVGGVDLRDVDATSRREAIRVVPQDGFLFDTTLGANVAYGRAGSTPGEIALAFESLDLQSWLSSLPSGLETSVGERGESVSVGERQLIALVRAQLADPGLLILDEATSAVDAKTEVALTAALERLAAGRTTITIAHRLSTAEQADTVLVFDQGVLVEEGSHDELVALGGRYADLHHSWVGGTRSDAE
jgi:ATP-binding cassette, subfamily B, bacterial